MELTGADGGPVQVVDLAAISRLADRLAANFATGRAELEQGGGEDESRTWERLALPSAD